VAIGATYLERHYTLDKEMKGTDHACSLERGEVVELMSRIGDVDIMMGDGNKYILDSEEPAIKKLRYDLRT
jgi:N-acetylneuraminate synthase